MLVLSLHSKQRVRIRTPDGKELWVSVQEVRLGIVRLGFAGPREFEIAREEVLEREGGK